MPNPAKAASKRSGEEEDSNEEELPQDVARHSADLRAYQEAKEKEQNKHQDDDIKIEAKKGKRTVDRKAEEHAALVHWKRSRRVGRKVDDNYWINLRKEQEEEYRKSRIPKTRQEEEEEEREHVQAMADYYGSLRAYQDAKHKEEIKHSVEKTQKPSNSVRQDDSVVAPEGSATQEEDDDDYLIVLEVPKLVHVDHRFHYLAFKEWYQINGWRFLPGATWTPRNNQEKHYLDFLGYHDRSFRDRKPTPTGAVPDDATHISLMYVTWLRRWTPPATPHNNA